MAQEKAFCQEVGVRWGVGVMERVYIEEVSKRARRDGLAVENCTRNCKQPSIPHLQLNWQLGWALECVLPPGKLVLAAQGGS